MQSWERVLQLPIVSETAEAAHATMSSYDLDRLDGLIGLAVTASANSVRHYNASCGGEIVLMLSGGVDSSLGAMYLRRRYPSAKITAYTIGRDPDDEDVASASLVAQSEQFTHRIFIPSKDLLDRARAQLRFAFRAKNMTASVDLYCGEFLLCQRIHEDGYASALSFAGADDLLGGRVSHRRAIAHSLDVARTIFSHYWSSARETFVLPHRQIALLTNLILAYPYFSSVVARAFTDIPLPQRTSIRAGKLPLRCLAKRYGVPEEILDRPKRLLRDSFPPPPPPPAE